MARSRIDPAKLKDLIEAQKLRQWQAAEILGVSVSAIERACKRLGLKTSKTGPRRGPEHPDWKGGRVLIGGYWHLWIPDHPNASKRGYVAEHRWAVSALLGRPLAPQEVVHHIDGDPKNNDPDNLMLFGSNAEHLRHELTGRVPQWSPEGKERMREGNRQMHIRNRLKRGG